MKRLLLTLAYILAFTAFTLMALIGILLSIAAQGIN